MIFFSLLSCYITHAVCGALEIHLGPYKTLSFSLVIIYTTSFYILRKTEKPADRGRLQRPKPNLVRSSGRRETASQEKMEAETSSPNLRNTDEKVRRRKVALNAMLLMLYAF